MIGHLSPDEIEGVLQRQRVGRLACSADDHPYLVPISYVYEDGQVFALSALGRKIEMMRCQPRVCFEVEEIEHASAWRCVIAEGIYEELPEGPTRQSVVRRLADAGRPMLPPIPEATTSPNTIVFRLRLTGKSGRFERRDA